MEFTTLALKFLFKFYIKIKDDGPQEGGLIGDHLQKESIISFVGNSLR